MTATARKLPIPKLTISRVARESIVAGGGDAVKATAIMFNRIMKDPELYRLLMNPLAQTACYDAIRLCQRHSRSVIWHTTQPSAEDERGRIIALAGGTMSSLMDFPLPGGLRLANALREDVDAAAEFYALQSQDMDHKASWLRLVAKATPRNKTVGDALNADRLAVLRKEAENG